MADTYSYSPDSGATWQGKRLPKREVETVTGLWGGTDSQYADEGYYRDILAPYPVDTPATCRIGPDYSGDPILKGIDAEWPVLYHEGAQCEAVQREAHRATLEEQLPIVTITDEAKDSTARAKAEQAVAKLTQAMFTLEATPGEDLPDFDTDLSNYDSSEQDYAGNLAIQEARNLLTDKELKDSGGTGNYTASEISAMQSRIAWNEGVSQGTQTGVQTPTVGAPRGHVALENEDAEIATFQEAVVEWPAGTPNYLPQVRMPPFPDGVDPAQVFCMIYGADNVYRSWTPFEEQPDGTWLSRVSTSDIASSEPDPSNWRVAVAYGGTQSEYEITERVHLLAAQATTSIVRFGGRT